MVAKFSLSSSKKRHTLARVMVALVKGGATEACVPARQWARPSVGGSRRRFAKAARRLECHSRRVHTAGGNIFLPITRGGMVKSGTGGDFSLPVEHATVRDREGRGTRGPR